MNYLIWLIPIILLIGLTGVLIWTMRRRKKIRNAKASVEYEEVLNDFITAENMYAQSLKGGSNYGKGTNPYTILWEIAKSKREQFAGEGTGSRGELPPLPKLPPRPDSFQRPIDETAPNYEPESSGNQRRDSQSIRRRRLFGRKY